MMEYFNTQLSEIEISDKSLKVGICDLNKSSQRLKISLECIFSNIHGALWKLSKKKSLSNFKEWIHYKLQYVNTIWLNYMSIKMHKNVV